MQLQHLRRRLQALIGTKKSLPDVIEILELLYAELNASATFLTRRDMANFLYICREALSWGPAAILKVSLVLDLLVSTDTYLLGQILTQNPHVSGVFVSLLVLESLLMRFIQLEGPAENIVYR